MNRRRVFSAAPWEGKVGYCRAIKAGDLIFVTGTAAVDDQGKTFEPGNAYAQAKRCLFLIERALKQLGTDLSSVVRTRMFVTDISKWQEFGRAHGEAFRDFPPATTMVEVKALIDPDMLIEIEADAVVSGPAD
jgi:enamine deaminase RidA (YjgF/YER057c/UK114 family)